MTQEKPQFIGKIKIENTSLWKDKELNKKSHNIYCLINTKHLELSIKDQMNKVIVDPIEYIVTGNVFNTEASFFRNVQLEKKYNLIWFDDCYYLGTIEFLEFGE